MLGEDGRGKAAASPGAMKLTDTIQINGTSTSSATKAAKPVKA